MPFYILIELTCYNPILKYIYPFMKNIFLPLLLILPILTNAQSSCSCTDCPKLMYDYFVGDLHLQVEGATNSTLGQNGQGVCGVNLHFDHEYVGDLYITLTSPSGQTIALVGPTDFSGFTNNVTWDVSFVPCGVTAVPDPGIAPTWNNDQNWVAFTTYTGSYYPYSGCLENFNAGPVNGEWTLSILDNLFNDIGNIIDYEIVFCDPTGIDCFSCGADAGELTYNNITACQGNAILNLSLPPDYVQPVIPPASTLYSYTYAISGANSVLLGYSPTTDLRSYPPGTYTICGISYLTAQSALLPAPNGVLTIAQLTQILNSTTPNLCAKITTNCVDITILPPLPNLVVSDTICAPNCYNFYSTSYCNSGTYTTTINEVNCSYTATLNLTVLPVVVTNISEFICTGSCSQTPGFSGFCNPGQFSKTFINPKTGCDSIVNLNLSVLIVTANIQIPNILTCANPITTLSGSGSSVGANITYQWSTTNGTIMGANDGINVQVSAAGTYKLLVCNILTNGSCCDSMSVTVQSNAVVPIAPTSIIGVTQICVGSSANFSVLPVPNTDTYTWTVPSGATITSGQGTNGISVLWTGNSNGDICVTANNLCGSSTQLCSSITAIPVPVPGAPLGNLSVCAGTTETYTIPALLNTSSYTWTVSAPASIAAGQGTNTVDVFWGNASSGTLCVRSIGTCGISTSACTNIQISTIPPIPVLSGLSNACSAITQNYSIVPIPGASNYIWQVTGGTIVSGGTGSSTFVEIDWNTNIQNGSVCVQSENTCGASAPACMVVAISHEITAPPISGNTSMCLGSSATSYTTAIIPTATAYNWSIPNGLGTIISGQNTPSISVQWNSTPGGSVCLNITGGCGPSPETCLPVTIYPQPIANAGVDVSVCGTLTSLSAIPSVAGSTGSWTQISGPGNASYSQPNNSNTLIAATLPGAYQILWQENISACSDVDTVLVHFNPIPSIGQLVFNCNAAANNFTVTFPVVGGTAPFTVAGGQVINNVFVSDPLANGLPFNFVVADANGCESPISFGTYNCNCASSAGQMNLTTISVCADEMANGIHLGGENIDGNDAFSYVLHTSSGPSLGTVIAQNTTGSFAFQSGMAYESTYYISYVVGNAALGLPDPNDLCLSVAQGQPVIFHAYPITNAGLDESTCSLSYSLNGNTVSGTWTTINGPSGGNLVFSNTQNALSGVTASAYGVYTLSWGSTNFGCTSTDTVEITFTESPNADLSSYLCDSTNEAYTVLFQINGGTAPYIVNGIEIIGTMYQSGSITNGNTFSFDIEDAIGCGTQVVSGMHTCLCSTDAGNMNLDALSVCEGQGIQVLYPGGLILDGNDTSLYVLHTNSGTSLGSIIQQNNTGFFDFNLGMSYGTLYYVSVVAGNHINGQLVLTDPCLSIAQGQPVVFYQSPTADAGLDQATCGTTSTLAGQLSVGSAGVWTVVQSPPNSNTLIDNINDENSTISVSKPGTYIIDWTVTRNGCSNTDQVSLTFNESPSLFNLQKVCDPINENFTVTLTILGGTLPYTINGVPNNSALYTSTPFANGSPYTFDVSDANGCTMTTIKGTYNCNCTTDAGTMPSDTIKACAGSTISIVANNDQILDPNDITSYVMHDGTGSVLGSQIFAQNATGVFSQTPNMQLGVTYYVSIIAGNDQTGLPDPDDPCFSVSKGQPIVFLAAPDPNTMNDTIVCGKEMIIAVNNAQFNGTWSLVSGPGTASFSDNNSAQTTLLVSDLGSYIFKWWESNGACDDSTELRVTFNDVPILAALQETCNGTNTEFNVTFEIVGGSAPYSVNGLVGSLTDNIFTSNLLSNGSNYVFTIEDSNGCKSPQISGENNCNCSTDAGNMISAAAVFCEGQEAFVLWNNAATLDTDDTLRFILHDQQGTIPGNILAINTLPVFEFGPDLQTGVTYYISAIAGNNVNGTIDLDDPCLSVASGTPVKWKKLPNASLSGDLTICEGSSTILTFNVSGDLPLQLLWTDGSGANKIISLNNTGIYTQVVAPTTTTIYELITISDGSNPVCSVNIGDQATITVNDKPFSGLAAPPLDFCENESKTIPLSGRLSGADSNGIWSETSLFPSSSGAFNPLSGIFKTDGQAPGTYIFAYTVIGKLPCPDAVTEVKVIIHKTPTADAGIDKVLICGDPIQTLGGTGTSVINMQHLWSLNGQPVAYSPEYEASMIGTYSLLVTSNFGCTALDYVNVTLDIRAPYGRITAIGVQCYGDKNGAIIIDSIQTIHPPVLASINGGSFTDKFIFYSILPGKYTITLQDAFGCEWTSDSITVSQPLPLLPDLGVDFFVDLGDSTHVFLEINRDQAALDTIIWSPLFDSSAVGLKYQNFYTLESRLLTVTVKDTMGCEARDQLLIVINKKRHIYVPNIILPGDPENGIATVFGGQDVESIKTFQIFDRWGNQQFDASGFQPDDKNKGWDGTFRGNPVSPGVYVYYVIARFIDGVEEVFEGDITVLR